MVLQAQESLSEQLRASEEEAFKSRRVQVRSCLARFSQVHSVKIKALKTVVLSRLAFCNAKQRCEWQMKDQNDLYPCFHSNSVFSSVVRRLWQT